MKNSIKITFFILNLFFLKICTEPICVFFAGPLFNIQEIIGNQKVAEAIQRLSNNKYKVILPQNLTQFNITERGIRDQDLKNLLSSRAGIFNFNGTDVDSGTAVEYIFAKFANKPSVILRTDFRNNSKECIAFNLMLKFYPRSKTIKLDALKIYHNKNLNLQNTIDAIASKIIKKLDEVLKVPPILIGKQKQIVDNWITKLINA